MGSVYIFTTMPALLLLFLRPFFVFADIGSIDRACGKPSETDRAPRRRTALEHAGVPKLWQVLFLLVAGSALGNTLAAPLVQPSLPWCGSKPSVQGDKMVTTGCRDSLKCVLTRSIAVQAECADIEQRSPNESSGCDGAQLPLGVGAPAVTTTDASHFHDQVGIKIPVLGLLHFAATESSRSLYLLDILSSDCKGSRSGMQAGAVWTSPGVLWTATHRSSLAMVRDAQGLRDSQTLQSQFNNTFTAK